MVKLNPGKIAQVSLRSQKGFPVASTAALHNNLHTNNVEVSQLKNSVVPGIVESQTSKNDLPAATSNKAENEREKFDDGEPSAFDDDDRKEVQELGVLNYTLSHPHKYSHVPNHDKQTKQKQKQKNIKNNLHNNPPPPASHQAPIHLPQETIPPLPFLPLPSKHLPTKHHAHEGFYIIHILPLFLIISLVVVLVFYVLLLSLDPSNGNDKKGDNKLRRGSSGGVSTVCRLVNTLFRARSKRIKDFKGGLLWFDDDYDDYDDYDDIESELSNNSSSSSGGYNSNSNSNYYANNSNEEQEVIRRHRHNSTSGATASTHSQSHSHSQTQTQVTSPTLRGLPLPAGVQQYHSHQQQYQQYSYTSPVHSPSLGPTSTQSGYYNNHNNNHNQPVPNPPQLQQQHQQYYKNNNLPPPPQPPQMQQPNYYHPPSINASHQNPVVTGGFGSPTKKFTPIPTPPPPPIPLSSSTSETCTLKYTDLKIQKLIGGGAFGQVWSGVYRQTPVAVKVLSPSAQNDTFINAEMLEEFKLEVEMLSLLRHPNICLFMGACFDSPNRAIVTELVARGSLWDCLRRPLSPPFAPADGATLTGWPIAPGVGNIPPPKGTWPFALFKKVGAGAARGMAYLHSERPRAILHRDLKSANLLLDELYTPKICDFGLARLKAFTNSHTGNCGTVQWMAKEVLANEKYSEPADVYSFGVILWEILTRECPFEGMTQIQVAMQVLNEGRSVEVPEWVRGGMPGIAGLMERCLSCRPERRPTFEQILEVLDA